MTLDDGSEHPGVASLGVRPTFDPPQELLEAHLFDFDGDLYGRKIEVALHAFIRDEQKFDDIDALVAQMRSDEAKREGCWRTTLARRLRRECRSSNLQCCDVCIA